MNNYMKNKCFWGLMLIAAISLTWVSCSKDDEKEDPNKNIVRMDTYAISPTFVYGMYLVNHPKNKPYLENTWSAEGASFHVYVLQNNNFTDLGRIESKETSIASADRQKPVHVDVPIPTNIDVDKSYQVIFTDKKTNLLNNKIVLDAELIRDTNTYCPSWKIAQGGNSATSQSSYLMTYEVLYVKNNTAVPIKVKHMGFETLDKWYCTNGKVNITPALGLETIVASTSGEVMSQEKIINANEEIFFECRYVPTGKKMTNARLILEVDGKEVKTPVVSSDISIECGIPYFMKVKWDGQNLEWD